MANHLLRLSQLSYQYAVKDVSHNTDSRSLTISIQNEYGYALENAIERVV